MPPKESLWRIRSFHSPADPHEHENQIIGTSRWIGNGFLTFNGNRDLYMNMLNWLSSDEDLISIRPKDPEDRRLNMNPRQAAMLFWGSVVFIPLAIIVAGVGVWWKRR